MGEANLCNEQQCAGRAGSCTPAYEQEDPLPPGLIRGPTCVGWSDPEWVLPAGLANLANSDKVSSTTKTCCEMPFWILRGTCEQKRMTGEPQLAADVVTSCC